MGWERKTFKRKIKNEDVEEEHTRRMDNGTYFYDSCNVRTQKKDETTLVKLLFLTRLREEEKINTPPSSCLKL